MSEWDKDLKDGAYKIASNNSSTIRVLAGPGTGKTFSLKRRVLRLLELDKIDPHRILVVTFTRVAAKDLENEIRNLPDFDVNNITIRTLHSLCYSILTDVNVIRIRNRKPRILNTFETRILLEDIKHKLKEPYNLSIYDLKRLLHDFEAAWAREQDQVPGWPASEIDRSFQESLDEWLGFHSGILLDQLIPLTLRFLRENPASDYLHRFTHVLVDEYQDLNKAEQSLIDLIATRSNFFIVGDEDQSIYEDFRHAHPEGIINFQNTHPNTECLDLTLCRRCPPKIVTIANNLISNNKKRLSHVLQPNIKNIDNNSINIIQWVSLEEESKGIAEYLAFKVHCGEFDPAETIVLCTNKYIGLLLKTQLDVNGIISHCYFHEEKISSSPVEENARMAQNAYSLYSLLSNKEDLISLRCWLGIGSNNFRTEAYRNLFNICMNVHRSVPNILDESMSNIRSFDISDSLKSRYESFLSYKKEFSNLDGRQLFNMLFPPDAEWAESIRNSVVFDENEISIEDCFDNIRRSLFEQEIPRINKNIRIMSFHKSKGLSADNVILLGCSSGFIPKIPDNSLAYSKKIELLEEQRRLFYVGLTRTNKNLLISSFLSFPKELSYKLGIPNSKGRDTDSVTSASMFISELGLISNEREDGNDFLSRELKGLV